MNNPLMVLSLAAEPESTAATGEEQPELEPAAAGQPVLLEPQAKQGSGGEATETESRLLDANGLPGAAHPSPGPAEGAAAAAGGVAQVRPSVPDSPKVPRDSLPPSLPGSPALGLHRKRSHQGFRLEGADAAAHVQVVSTCLPPARCQCPPPGC